MTGKTSLEERLDQLGHELKIAPSISRRVVEAVESRPRLTAERSTSWQPRAVAGLLAAFASLAIALSIYVAARPSTLYAQAVDALKAAKTIHVTGKTTRIVRKWPLEGSAVPQEAHDVDAWFWSEGDGTPRAWSKTGPVVLNQNGPQLEEFQADADLLYVRDGAPDDFVARIGAIASFLNDLDRPGVNKESLGTREQERRTLRGLKVTQGNRVEEYWFDSETHLPVSLQRTEQMDSGMRDIVELRFSYDGSVPAAVAAWVAPKATNRRYGSGERAQEAWLAHAAAIGDKLNRTAADRKETTLLLDRAGATFSLQYPVRTPDGAYWVVPIDVDQHQGMTLEDFFRLHVARETPVESWRVPEELLDRELKRQDLVFPDGTPWATWVGHLLSAYDLELIDREEERTVWIARHDGRKLRSWKDVAPPMPYLPKGGPTVDVGVGHRLTPVTLQTLFADFNNLQNHYLTADSPVIEDQTGLPHAPEWDRKKYQTQNEYAEKVLSDYYVATDSPWFIGGKRSAKSTAMARDWYQQQFGITFEEVRRPMAIHVVRQRSR